MTVSTRLQDRPAVSRMGHDVAESRADQIQERSTDTPLTFEAALDRVVSLHEQFDLAEIDDTITTDLREAQRLLMRLGAIKVPALDVETLAERHQHQADSTRHRTADVATAQQPPTSGEAAAIAATGAIGVGLMLFVCGGALLAMSVLQKRSDLWSIGLPLVIVGQAGLIIGLLLQLDWLRSSSRKTTAAIEQLDSHLQRLEQSSPRTIRDSVPSTNLPTFASHYAQGASPQVLLADLKGQLDLLAKQLAEK